MKIVRCRRCVCKQRSKSHNINRLDNIQRSARHTPALGNEHRRGRDAYKDASLGVLPHANLSLVPPTSVVCTNGILEQTHQSPNENKASPVTGWAGRRHGGNKNARGSKSIIMTSSRRELLFQSQVLSPRINRSHLFTGNRNRSEYWRTCAFNANRVGTG